MKKTVLTTTLLFAALTTIGQNDRSKKVESKYLSLPAYDISTTDPATVSIEFAMKEPSFGTEKLKDYESVCKPSGGSVKDAVKITTYYYEIPYNKPESYVVAKSTDGTVVYASKASEVKSDIIKFGFDKCEYWVSDKMKKDYQSKGSSFKNSEHKKYEDEVYKTAIESAKANVYLSYLPEEFEVFSAKGKAYDYTDLDNALDKALAAYASIEKNGLNKSDLDRLTEAIAIWEKELETLDTEDKKARITSDIGKGLHENCARAYLYLYEFDKALIHARKFMELYGNFSNNRSNAFKEVMLRIELQKVAAEKNAGIITDLNALNNMASASSKTVAAQRLGSTEFDRLYSEFLNFRMGQAKDVNEDRKEDEAEAIASGELNPYQKWYSPVAVGGPGILMTLAPSALSGVPELKELPKEMCEFTDAQQLLILNNKIESVPAEIAKLKALKKLDLSGNNLSTLPAEIGQLENLETLKLSGNPLVSLPVELANCTKLSSLVIKDTKLSESAIAELQRLLPECKIKN